MSQIFVVSNDNADLTAMLGVFASAGYSATGATTFEEAQRRLANESPDLVIADERLGAFNGLHVLLTARAARPETRGIITTPVANRGLEADARSLNVTCMVKPRTASEWLGPISSLLPAACVA
jgi:DNA-binding NtrC family response regulator